MTKIYQFPTTRRAFLSTVAATAAATPLKSAPDITLPLGVPAAATNQSLQPTELGLELLQLLPDHAEACWHGCNLEIDDPDGEAVEAWEDSAWEAIKERAQSATELVDLAIAHRIWRGGEASDGDEDCEPFACVADRLSGLVLSLAGVPSEMCVVDQYWAARGWAGRAPTKAERLAAVEAWEVRQTGDLGLNS